MEPKQPAVLAVLVQTGTLRWFVAGIGLDGERMPLLCSPAADLEPYLDMEFDEQASFVRHRFCGVLQQGCDRLWARSKKPVQFVFVFEEPLGHTTGDLTLRVAEHFVQWMTNPPVVVYLSENGFEPAAPPKLHKLAGDIPRPLADVVTASLPGLYASLNDDDAWEMARKKQKTQDT